MGASRQLSCSLLQPQLLALTSEFPFLMDTKFVEGNLCLFSVEHPEMTEERKIQKVRWAREHAHKVCV